MQDQQEAAARLGVETVVEERQLLDELGELLPSRRLAVEPVAAVCVPLAQLRRRARLDDQLSEHVSTLHGSRGSICVE